MCLEERSRGVCQKALWDLQKGRSRELLCRAITCKIAAEIENEHCLKSVGFLQAMAAVCGTYRNGPILVPIISDDGMEKLPWMGAIHGRLLSEFLHPSPESQLLSPIPLFLGYQASRPDKID